MVIAMQMAIQRGCDMPFHDYVNVDDPTDILIDEVFVSVHDDVPKEIERDGKKYKHLARFPGAVILKGGDWTGGPAAPGQTFMSAQEIRNTRENEAIRRDKVTEFNETKANNFMREKSDEQTWTDGVQGKLREIQDKAARARREKDKTYVPQ